MRRLSYGIWKSVALYGTPIWASSLGREKNRRVVKGAQRTALIRTFTVYRTVSHGAWCVVTGNMPIQVKAWLW